MNGRLSRLTGYACVFLVLAAVLAGAMAFAREISRPERRIQVQFSELGTLMRQDPVVQNGAIIGRVEDIHLRDGLPVADIELFRSDFIAEDSRFVNYNHSLMGARMVVFFPGRSTSPMNESQVQYGAFAGGVAESIHRVDELLKMVADMRVQIRRLFADSGLFSPRLAENLEKNAQGLEHLAQQIEDGGGSLRSGLQTWIRTEKSVQKGFATVTPGIRSGEKHAAAFLNTALTAERDADAIVTAAEKLLASVEKPGMIRSLLEDRKAYDELDASLRLIDSAARTFRAKGLNGAVKWRNLHFFRSKSP